MAFFQKLKERLFKSSSRIEEGIDAIIGDAPVEAAMPEARPGIVGRILGGEERGRVLDDAMLESLEELLIQSDMGVETSLKVAAAIAEARFGRRIGADEVRRQAAREHAASPQPVARAKPNYTQAPHAVLV